MTECLTIVPCEKFDFSKGAEMLGFSEGDGSLSRTEISERFQGLVPGEIIPAPHGSLQRPTLNVSPKNGPKLRANGERGLTKTHGGARG